MSNQDQYGSKTQSNQYGDDFDSLSDDQKIQRKEQHASQQGGQSTLGGQGAGAGMGGKDDLGQTGASNQYGDDFDSLSDDQKIQRKEQYAQGQGGSASSSLGGTQTKS